MVSHTTPARADEADGLLFDSWFDPAIAEGRV
jgi:hypothetical protein